MSQVAPRVLVVDDEPGLAATLGRLLARAGNEVETATSGHEAIARVADGAFDVVVSDVHMPGMDGLSLLRAIRSRDLDLPVVFLSGNPSLDTAIEAVEHGAFRYLTKPIEGAELAKVVARAAQVRRLALLRREADGDGARRAAALDRAGAEALFGSAVETMWLAMQPILSWRTRSVFGYEALLRTEEPTLRDPLEFLAAAERLGRTAELGRLVRERVADRLIELPTSVSVFVNVHATDLLEEELASPTGVLTPYARGVVLEVTERAALEQVRGIVPAVERLRALGYRIALDDMGAGYAGLSSFALLQPDIVKVDMSLVRGIHRSATKQKLFRSFATLCRELDTELVAEGVELPEERDCLDELGGDLYQGFLFARPGRGYPTPTY